MSATPSSLHRKEGSPPSLATEEETKIPPDRRGQEAGLVERGDKREDPVSGSCLFFRLLGRSGTHRGRGGGDRREGRVESKWARRDGGGRPPTHRPKGETLGGRGRRREAQATAHIRESCFPLSPPPSFFAATATHPPKTL